MVVCLSALALKLVRGEAACSTIAGIFLLINFVLRYSHSQYDSYLKYNQSIFSHFCAKHRTESVNLYIVLKMQKKLKQRHLQSAK